MGALQMAAVPRKPPGNLVTLVDRWIETQGAPQRTHVIRRCPELSGECLGEHGQPRRERHLLVGDGDATRAPNDLSSDRRPWTQHEPTIPDVDRELRDASGAKASAPYANRALAQPSLERVGEGLRQRFGVPTRLSKRRRERYELVIFHNPSLFDGS